MYTCYTQSLKILASFCRWAAGLNLTWSKISEDTFLRDEAQLSVQLLDYQFSRQNCACFIMFMQFISGIHPVSDCQWPSQNFNYISNQTMQCFSIILYLFFLFCFFFGGGGLCVCVFFFFFFFFFFWLLKQRVLRNDMMKLVISVGQTCSSFSCI